MRLPSWAVLTAVAGGFGLGIGAMSILLNKELDRSANQAMFVKKAIDIMRNEPQVEQLLGGSIEVGNAKLLGGWSKVDKEVQIKVPIKGELDNAYLYAYGRRKKVEDRFKLFKIEATFDKVRGKKLVLLDHPDEEDKDDKDATAEKQEQEDGEKKLLDKNEISKRIAVDQKLSWKEQMKSWK